MLHKLPCLIYLHFSNLTCETKRSPQPYLAVSRDVTNNKRSMLRRQSRDTNRNMKRLVYCQYGKWSLTFRALPFVRERWPSDEGPTLETLDFTIHIGSTPIFSYFNLYHIKVRLHAAITAITAITGTITAKQKVRQKVPGLYAVCR